MVSKEKVINGLECIRAYLKNNGNEEGYCPYVDDTKGFFCIDCLDDVIDDALELLQPRVLKLHEALGNFDPVFCEVYGNFCFWTDGLMDSTLKNAILYRFGTGEVLLPLCDYGYSWRCWSGKPSEKQKLETAWEKEEES